MGMSFDYGRRLLKLVLSPGRDDLPRIKEPAHPCRSRGTMFPPAVIGVDCLGCGERLGARVTERRAEEAGTAGKTRQAS